MSQDIWTTINPNVTGGTMLASLLNSLKDAICSGMSGTSRPANLQAGGMWVDTTNSLTPNFYYSCKLYTGTADVEVFRVNVNSNFGGGLVASSEFDITRISADTTAAILGFIKQRTLTNGQVLDGDVIGELQFIGRTDTSTDPIVGNIKWTSSDNETNSVYGGYLSIYSVPDASNTIAEHLRLIAGLVETVKPYKVNSLRLVGQNVATAATITQLDASKVLVEFTGATATSLQGINSGQNSQEVKLHNRSSATVTLNHQNAGAAAADRLKLPGGTDISLIADATIVLFYDLTDTRWKIKSTAHSVLGKNLKIFKGVVSDWTCPSGVTQVLVTPYTRRQTMAAIHRSCIDIWGNNYVWGGSLSGGLGDGTQVSKSSPVAIVGGVSFVRFAEGLSNRTVNVANDVGYGIDKLGNLYAWGANSNGQLGLGDVVARSSPVAVLGGKKFLNVFENGLAVYAIAVDGGYAWGKVTTGFISTAAGSAFASSPVAVLGGILWDSMDSFGPGGNTEPVWGLDINGNAYFAGASGGVGSYGQGGGGNGTQSVSSSPTAVIGGISFKKIGAAFTNANMWSVGLSKDGIMYAWGANSNGQLGLGDVVARSSPVAVLGGITFMDLIMPVQGINSGVGHVLGLAVDGTLYGWGDNNSWQIGVGDLIPRSSPVAVLGGLKFREVITLTSSVYGITIDGDMYAWGANSSGQLGVGDVISRSSPVAVLGGIKWSHFPHRGLPGAGVSINAVSADGTLYSWGSGVAENGLGDLTPRSSPVAVVGGIMFDTRSTGEVFAIPVTPGNTYRISLLNGRAAKFGNTCIGFNLEKCSVEYDTRGN